MMQRLHHPLGVSEVHIWHLLTDHVSISSMASAVQPLLSPEEQGRQTCYAHPRDQLMYVLSRGLMRTVLASYLRCPCHEVRFTANRYGKPILHAERDVPPLHFNLTHSRGAIALAVSRGREVGIDVEERQRSVDYVALAERFFAPPEARHLQQLREEQRSGAFFALWTLKEAFVKGIGRGLSFPLDAFCFELEEDRLIDFRPLADFVSHEWYFHQFELSPRHCGALAVQNPAGHGIHIEMFDWHAACAGLEFHPV